MNYYLHRISHVAELSYPLLDKGYLTIGFSDFTGEDIINSALLDKWDEFGKMIFDEWGIVPRSRFSLWNFMRMNKGDIVIVPSWGTFFICEVENEGPLPIGDVYSGDLKTWNGKIVIKKGNLLSSEENEIYDLGFARKVKVLYRNISRDKFADAALTSRMKVRQTNILINDLSLSIDESIRNFKLNKPIHLHSIIVDKTANVVLDAIKTGLNPNKFEKLVKIYFQAIGANDVTIPPRNDSEKSGDADVVAVFESLRLIIYAQIKFHEGEINEWGIIQIQDYKKYKESSGDGYNKIAWLITTANSFNESAENMAKENGIQLVNGIEFSKMLLNVGINLLNTEL